MSLHIKEEIKEEEEKNGVTNECLEEHKELYKDVMMEDEPDGSRKRNPPQRCPCPQDSSQEHHEIPHHDQKEEMFSIKTEVKEEEETYVCGYPQSMMEAEMMKAITKEESSLDSSSTGGHNGLITSDGCLILSSHSNKEDTATAQHPAGGTIITQNIHHKLNPLGRASDELGSEESKDKSNIMIPNVQPSLHSTATTPGPSNSGKSTYNILLPVQLVVYQVLPRSQIVYSCSECEKTFNSESYLIEHQRVHTGEKLSLLFSCPECTKSFSSESRLKTHQMLHTGERPFSCSECTKSFSTKTRLKTHQKIHMDEKPFACSECDKAFKFKEHLIRHYRMHTGEKPFLCTLCGKTFPHKAVLKTHQRIHTGEKPFLCLLCGKNFPHKSVLKAHQSVHTGEKPFSCSECAKSFTQKNALIKHIKTHTGEKPFSCSECGKCFIAKRKRDDHFKTHSREKPFNCSVCGKSYTHKGTLLQHLRIHSLLKHI